MSARERGRDYEIGFDQGYREGFRVGKDVSGLALQIPLPGGGQVRICGPFPVTPEAWALIKQLMDLTANALVVEPVGDHEEVNMGDGASHD